MVRATMNAVCEVCGVIGYEHLLLCCCDCKGAHTHQYCLDKVLYDASLEDWFCNECNQRHNEGSHSRSLVKVSSERPSKHARFDSTSEQPNAKRLESAKHSSNFTEQLNLSTGQVRSASSSKGVKQPTSVIVNSMGYTLGDTGTSQSHMLKQLEWLAPKSMQTPQSVTTDQANSTSPLGISSKAKSTLEASAIEAEISDTVQNLRKDSPKKHRRLILTGDDEDVEEKAEDVQQENVNHQPLKCNEPMVKHQMNAECYVEEAVQTGDINDQNLINGRPMKPRRRYIVENEDEEDIEGAESALNNASKRSLNDSAKLASQTPIATDHSLQSRSSDSEYLDRQNHICLQPLDEPVWSGVFKIDNKMFLKLDAHLSNKACQRVHELSGLLEPIVEVRTLSRLQAWPKRWISSGPTDDNIGLFFLPHSSMQNEELTRLNRMIKSDDALQVTVGIAELLIFPSVLLPEQYHLFQGKHYLWGVFRQRKDILDNGVHVEEQGGSAHATGEERHQKHDLLDQDESLYELSDKETFAVKHVVDTEHQLQVEGDPEVQNDNTKVATSEGITSLSSSWSPAKPDSSKAGSNSSVQPITERKLDAPGAMEQQEDFTSSPQWNASSITKQSSAAVPAEHGNNQAHPGSEPSTTKLFGFVAVRTPRSQQLIQEMVSEGAVLFPVPEEIAMTDSIIGSSTGVVSSSLNPDAKCEAPQALDFVSLAVGHGDPGVDSEACLELFPVRQEQIGWTPRAEVSGEVDLNLSLGKRPPALSLPPLL